MGSVHSLYAKLPVFPLFIYNFYIFFLTPLFLSDFYIEIIIFIYQKMIDTCIMIIV